MENIFVSVRREKKKWRKGKGGERKTERTKNAQQTTSIFFFYIIVEKGLKNEKLRDFQGKKKMVNGGKENTQTFPLHTLHIFPFLSLEEEEKCTIHSRSPPTLHTLSPKKKDAVVSAVSLLSQLDLFLAHALFPSRSD